VVFTLLQLGTLAATAAAAVSPTLFACAVGNATLVVAADRGRGTAVTPAFQELALALVVGARSVLRTGAAVIAAFIEPALNVRAVGQAAAILGATAAAFVFAALAVAAGRQAIGLAGFTVFGQPACSIAAPAAVYTALVGHFGPFANTVAAESLTVLRALFRIFLDRAEAITTKRAIGHAVEESLGRDTESITAHGRAVLGARSGRLEEA